MPDRGNESQCLKLPTSCLTRGGSLRRGREANHVGGWRVTELPDRLDTTVNASKLWGTEY